MAKQTLTERARALVQSRPKLTAALAATALADASSVQAVIVIGSGTVDFPDPSDATFPLTTSGGPLTTFGGTNGTNSVSLAGFADVIENEDSSGIGGNTAELVFENLGTISADAGQFVRVDFDFDQFAQATSGGTFDISFSLDLDIDNGNITAGDSETTNLAFGSGASTTFDRSGSFVTQPFATDLESEDLSLVLTGTFDTNGEDAFRQISITVPQSSITISVIPEPSSFLIFAALATFIVGLKTLRRRRSSTTPQAAWLPWRWLSLADG